MQEMQRRKVLVYSHIFPFPPRHGAHQRMLQILNYFVGRRFQVHLLSGSADWDNRFDPQAVNLPISVHELKLTGSTVRLDTLWRRIRKIADRDLSVSTQWSLSRKLRQISPALVVVNYSSGMRALPKKLDVPVIVDAHDILTMSKFLSDRARAMLNEVEPKFEPLGDALSAFSWEGQCKAEADLLSRAKLVLGISTAETNMFAKLTATAVITVSFCVPEKNIAPTGEAPFRHAMGVMPLGTGDNPHNCLGAIMLDNAFNNSSPAQISPLAVGTGRASLQLPLGPWFQPRGEIDDYQSFIGQYAYGICPAFWGTGAQVKQYEFAAQGMPVIGYRDTLDLDIWVHNYNSILVSTPEELKSAIVELANNSERLKSLRRGASRMQKTLLKRNTMQNCELDARVEALIGHRT